MCNIVKLRLCKYFGLQKFPFVNVVQRKTTNKRKCVNDEKYSAANTARKKNNNEQ